MRWSVVVPVKPVAIGKSRLGAGPELTRAIALDTIAAAVACPLVDRVIVVTADGGFRPPGAEVVLETNATGIDAAIRIGLAVSDGPTAVLLGDLPALTPEDLAAALELAAGRSRAFVADGEGTGTTLVTASAAAEFLSAFGPDSAARHRALGLVELPIPPSSTLRRDVDTREQLDAAAALGLGPATRAALEHHEGTHKASF